MSAESQVHPSPVLGRWLAGLAIAAVAWVFLYSNLTAFADAVIAALGLTRATHLGEAIHFHRLAGAPLARVLAADLSLTAGWRPGQIVLLAGVAILLAAALRRRGDRTARRQGIRRGGRSAEASSAAT